MIVSMHTSNLRNLIKFIIGLNQIKKILDKYDGFIIIIILTNLITYICVCNFQ